MGKVTVNLNGRAYRLSCGDGEEERLRALADYLGKKIDRLASEYGQIGDDRLTVMAALLVADELFDLRDKSATATMDDPLETAADSPDEPSTTAAAGELGAAPQANADDVLDEAETSQEDDQSRPEPLLKRALRRSQARAAQAPPSLEQRLAAAREGGSTDLKTGSG